jgi:hypothetical protein
MKPDALRGTLTGEAPMKVTEHFEQVGSRGFYRPVGQVSFEQAVEILAEGICTARDLGLADLIANSTGLTGFTPPSVFARHAMAVKWAQSAGPSMRVALIARPELIDPQKIGALMFQNRGGNGDVFANEADALAWLDARLGPGQRTPSFLNRSRTDD